MNGHNEKHWSVEVLIENDPVTFKVDTGAEVTALSDTTFHSLKHPELQLKKSNQTLCGPNRSLLDVLGDVTPTKTSQVKRVFVIHNLQHNLLGLPAIKALEVITGINAITQSIPEQYPRVLLGWEHSKESTQSNYNQMPNRSACLPLETYQYHYMRK